MHKKTNYYTFTHLQYSKPSSAHFAQMMLTVGALKLQTRLQPLGSTAHILHCETVKGQQCNESLPLSIHLKAHRPLESRQTYTCQNSSVRNRQRHTLEGIKHTHTRTGFERDVWEERKLQITDKLF